MEYTKVTCTLLADSELAREMLVAELGNLGFESFVEADESVEAYIPSNDYSPELMMAESLQKNDFFQFSFSAEVIADQNWNEVWEQNYFQPLLIGDHCVIRAPFHATYPDAPIQIIINPKMAFGTGNHETTTLMIQTILELNLKGKKVLDMGCGSGILAILASLTGAREILAIDIDEWSYNNTLENSLLNQCNNITAELGDADSLKKEKYEVIFANIQRNILLQDMEKYVAVLEPGGELLMSGFYMDDLPAIEEKAISLGLKPGGYKELSKWCAARFCR